MSGFCFAIRVGNWGPEREKDFLLREESEG